MQTAGVLFPLTLFNTHPGSQTAESRVESGIQFRSSLRAAIKMAEECDVCDVCDIIFFHDS